jgi:TatD DNase family protein
MIIETHAHLMFPEFEGEIAELIKRAKENGVEKIVNIGCGPESWKQAIEMLEEDDCLYASLGMHPYEAEFVNDDLIDEWRALISGNKRIVAIGECGLDYFKSQIPKDVQKSAFCKQLKLAQELSMPVIVHNREADEDSLEILEEFRVDGKPLKAAFHCYGSDLDFAQQLWDKGYMTSFTGIVTYPNARNLHEVVREVPMDMFMVETDCPYLAPQKYRGERNEPSYVVEVVREIAKLKGISYKEIEKAAEENSKLFFDRL